MCGAENTVENLVEKDIDRLQGLDSELDGSDVREDDFC